MGLAGADSAGTLGAVLPAAGPFPQEAHRLGPSDDPATPPLAASPLPGGGGRQRLRCPGPAPLLPIPPPTGYLHHPVAAGCRPLCPGAAAPAWPERPAPGERCASAHLENAARDQPAAALGHRIGGLVRQHDAHGGDHLRKPHSGITRANHPCPFAGSWFETPKATSTLRRYSAPTRQWPRRRSWNGLCCAGNWKPPSKRCGLTWEWKPSVSGSDRAIARTTPVLMGLFSWITLAAYESTKTTPDHPAYRSLVCQTGAHLRRCHRPGAPPPVDRIAHFFNVAASARRQWKKLPSPTLRPPYRLAGLRRLNVQSPA